MICFALRGYGSVCDDVSLSESTDFGGLYISGPFLADLGQTEESAPKPTRLPSSLVRPIRRYACHPRLIGPYAMEDICRRFQASPDKENIIYFFLLPATMKLNIFRLVPLRFIFHSTSYVNVLLVYILKCYFILSALSPMRIPMQRLQP